MNGTKPTPAPVRRVIDPKEQAAADAVLGALARDAQALALFDRATDLALEDPATAATTAQDALLMECAVRLQQHAGVRALLDLTGTLNRLRRVRDFLIDPNAPSGRNAGPARLRPGTELLPGQKTRFFEEDGLGLLVSWQGTPAERKQLQPYTDWWGQQLGGGTNTTGRPSGSGRFPSAAEVRATVLPIIRHLHAAGQPITQQVVAEHLAVDPRELRRQLKGRVTWATLVHEGTTLVTDS